MEAIATRRNLVKESDIEKLSEVLGISSRKTRRTGVAPETHIDAQCSLNQITTNWSPSSTGWPLRDP